MNPYWWLGIVIFVVLLAAQMTPVYLSRRQRNSRLKHPFNDTFYNPAGESLRIKIVVLKDEIDTNVVQGILVAIVVLILFLVPTKLSATSYIGAVIGASGCIFYCARKIKSLNQEIANYELGFQGERLVGQYLSQLLKTGSDVYHDIECEQNGNLFNLDHVVINASGVYCIETKTRRKSKLLEAKQAAQVEYDGKALEFPNYRDSKSVEQAKLNADYLARKLTAATGEPVDVQAVITMPGWFIKRTQAAKSAVMAVPTKSLAKFLVGNNKLSTSQLERIRHQLELMSQAL